MMMPPCPLANAEKSLAASFFCFSVQGRVLAYTPIASTLRCLYPQKLKILLSQVATGLSKITGFPSIALSPIMIAHLSNSDACIGNGQTADVRPSQTNVV